MSHFYPTADELRQALYRLAARAEVIVKDVNAAGTLQAYAKRFSGATAAASPAPREPTPVPEPAFDVEGIYARRRAPVVAAQAAQRGTP